MAERNDIIFVADVHLGLGVNDPREREERFVSFLKGIPRETTKALYLLGDIWDFWYEYRDVVPREGARVVAQLIDLMDGGVDVYFFEGNHDIWTFSFFESLGMKKLKQPYVCEIGGKTFCLGHGDCLGGAKKGYSFMLKVFHNRAVQAVFSTLHPWLAYRFGLSWSNSSRRSHKPYHFKNEEEPLYKFALDMSRKQHIDCFIFGHFHDAVDLELPTGARLIVVKDWMDGKMPRVVFNGTSFELRY